MEGQELPLGAEQRWYATNQRLPDGRIIIIGGRRQFNYEFYPRNSESSSSFWLEFLRETRDDDENNLYPFVHLLPDGNLFIFANTRAISLDYKHNRVVREFPSITIDDPRNYPSSGSSVLLPIDENEPIEAEVMVCGGAPRGAFSRAKQGIFDATSHSCGCIKVTDENPSWAMEDMPMPRVISDMILLPTGDVVIINGAGSGTAGWEIGQNPVTRPVIYKPHGVEDIRFSVMSPATRPRIMVEKLFLAPKIGRKQRGNEVLVENAMAELGRLLMYEASRDWLIVPILRAGLSLAEHASSTDMVNWDHWWRTLLWSM
ncbi:Aldehyde oxidase GLOX [Camellia lanceoleosa]|uniref:Aldehyde oxidase GLOX n=1 Tax=Camellia lanceoleosa TaxID=1840588 RepID=A0ACC0IJP0_9ERIC|nr:Aldehyde oxidase GLOX [Camellia lanceoleosa]